MLAAAAVAAGAAAVAAAPAGAGPAMPLKETRAGLDSGAGDVALLAALLSDAGPSELTDALSEA